VNYGDNLNTQTNRIIIFFFCIANAFCGSRSMASSNDEEVAVTVIYNALDELKLVFIRSWKEFHPSRYAIHLHEDLDYLKPLLFEICVGRADENLISFVYVPTS
jgi:hypothetical protein